MKYFEVKPIIDGAWHLFPDERWQCLKTGKSDKIWNYTKCQIVNDMTPVLFVQKYQTGCFPVEFNCPLWVNPLVTHRVADAIKQLSPNDIQRVPAKIEGEADEWEVLNILNLVDCLDYEYSKMTYKPFEEDKTQENILGFLKLVIDPEKVGDHHIFRMNPKMNRIIISETLLCTLREMQVTGLQVINVTDKYGDKYFNCEE